MSAIRGFLARHAIALTILAVLVITAAVFTCGHRTRAEADPPQKVSQY